MLKSIIIALSLYVCLVTCNDPICKDNKPNHLVADPKNPNIYHVCNYGKDLGTKTCPSVEEQFDENLQVCVFTEHFDKQCPERNGRFEYPGKAHKFLVCHEGYPYVFTCAADTVWVQSKQECEDNVDGKTDSTI